LVELLGRLAQQELPVGVHPGLATANRETHRVPPTTRRASRVDGSRSTR
jgi:hypothetical protein